MVYGILPLSASQRSHELTPVQWKVYSYYLSRWNVLTRQCNPSHKLISQDTGVNQTSVSTIKKELEVLGWLKRKGKYSVDLLVGRETLEEVRAERIARIQDEEGARFGRGAPQDRASSFEKFKARADDVQAENGASFEKFKGKGRKRPRAEGASFELFKAGDPEVRENQTPALKNSNPLEQRSRTDKEEAAAAAAAAAAGAHTWKQETVTQEFIADVVANRLHSQAVVEASWRELCFAVAQRGPGARATKGEFLAFCRAKERTLNLPGMETPADVANMRVARAPQSAPASPNFACDSTCELCHGGQLQVLPKGAIRCPNREARRKAAEQTEGVQT